ncbi:MAG TPA: lipoyl(octanoyl) transferase LipB, partial [Steroidobacteraceae bacterium]|nr:lipoyl(octanoyl) transferase LipB [Steroidobacteraceae bacterium]
RVGADGAFQLPRGAGAGRQQRRTAVDPVIIRRLGLVEYLPTWQAMQRFTDERGPGTDDEIWLLQHPPVFTLGMAADRGHVLAAGEVPVVQTDRGGQVTYHGPGQLVMYALIDLRRNGLGVRDLVVLLERSVIELAAAHGVRAEGRRDAPGVYVDGRKLASVGMRIRRGASYHGLALNVDMDLSPFARINPCGMAGMQVTQLRDLAVPGSVEEVGERLAQWLAGRLTAPA